MKITLLPEGSVPRNRAKRTDDDGFIPRLLQQSKHGNIPFPVARAEENVINAVTKADKSLPSHSAEM